MNLAVEIALSITICAVVFGLLWMAKGSMLTPMITGEGVRLIVTVKMTGDAKNTEQVIDGLLWLRDSGNTDMEIILDGSEANAAARQTAAVLAKKYKEIGLRGFHTEETEWKETDSNTVK